MRLETIILGIGVAVIAGLVLAFVSLADGVNQSAAELSARRAAERASNAEAALSATQTPEAEAPAEGAAPPADIVAPTVTANAPVVFGSVSMLTNTAREYIELDVASCTPGSGRVEVRYGEVILEMRGSSDSNCSIGYGTNIDSANAQGTLTMDCSVPAKLGKVRLATRDDGADFSPIDQYCTEVTEEAPGE
jgi:hypothetical protein